MAKKRRKKVKWTNTREFKMLLILRDLFDGLEWIQNGFYSFLLTTKGNPKQIDLYFPSIKLAFEHHGPQHERHVKYYHKTKRQFLDAKNRDKEKEKQLEKEGIDLIIIWYGDDLTHPGVVEIIKKSAPAVYNRMKETWMKGGYLD